MRIFACLIIALSMMACARSGKAVNLNETFTLKRGETANVSGTIMNLKMLENGTSQRPSGGDIVFCKFEVKFKGVIEEKTLEVGSFASFDELNIRLDKVNTAADISKTTCNFVVSKTMG